MIFLGPDFVITVRHGEAGGLGDVREHLEAQPELLALGPGLRLYAIVDRIVDAYEPVADGVHEDIEEVEAEVFSPESTNPVERIYRLRAKCSSSDARPCRSVRRCASWPTPAPQHRRELTSYFRDVADHAARVGDQIEGFATSSRACCRRP